MFDPANLGFPQNMPPRRSTRSQPTTAVDPAQPLVATSSSAPKPTKKAKTAAPSRKRAAADDSDEEQVKKPAKKKSKKETKGKVEDVQDDVAVDGDDQEEEEIVDDSNMVTVLKRGAAPVDPTCGFVSEFPYLPILPHVVINQWSSVSHQVYSSGNDVWDAMLNQTSKSRNAQGNA
jgi:poly [ADP-ribose] polymerase